MRLAAKLVYFFYIYIDVALRTSTMALLNAVVLKNPDLGERIKMREELKNMELNSVLKRLKETESEPKDADLMTQLEVFERMATKDVQDYEQNEFIDDVHLSDHRSVFEAVLKKAKGANFDSAFLSILQHLLLIPNEKNVRSS